MLGLSIKAIAVIAGGLIGGCLTANIRTHGLALTLAFIVLGVGFSFPLLELVPDIGAGSAFTISVFIGMSASVLLTAFKASLPNLADTLIKGLDSLIKKVFIKLGCYLGGKE